MTNHGNQEQLKQHAAHEKPIGLSDLTYESLHILPRYTKVTLRGAGTSEEILQRESPHNRKRCTEWRSAEELAGKSLLLVLLHEGKTPAAVAKYVNCSIQQVYRAMHHHNIPTKRIYRRENTGNHPVCTKKHTGRCAEACYKRQTLRLMQGREG